MDETFGSCARKGRGRASEVRFAGRAGYAVLAPPLADARSVAARGTSRPSASSLASALSGGALLDAREKCSVPPSAPTLASMGAVDQCVICC